MKSRLRQEKRRQLIEDARRMTSEQKLAAFANHSRLVCKLAEAGKTARKASPGSGR